MNSKLNTFKTLTKEEKIKELDRLEKIFPSYYPTWNNSLCVTDAKNLYLGRIITILDEFGETSEWHKYESINLEKMIENYDKLMLRYIKEIRPELLSEYMEQNGIEE